MSKFDEAISRRNLLKGIGAASLLAMLPRGADAKNAFSSGVSTAGKKAEGATRILSCNILVAWDEYKGTPKDWTLRRDLSEKVVRDQDADIICMQEVLREQSQDFAKAMPDYFQFGFPDAFNDAHPTGYHGVAKNIILFRKDRYQLTSAGSYWLSDTPLAAGSNSWDSARPRHCNWVRLKERQTGKEFRVLDVHLDHKGQTAREHQAAIIAQESSQYQNDFPQILGGHFIFHHEKQGLPDFDRCRVERYLHGGKRAAGSGLYGSSVAGSGIQAEVSLHGRIDFIYYRGDVKPLAAKIITENDNGKFPSDHYFLTAGCKVVRHQIIPAC